MPALGALLRQQREQAQLTQEELARRAQLSARTVSDIERGLRSRIYTDTAERLATALALTDPARSTFLAVARGRVPRESPLPATLLPRPLTPLLGREGELAAVTDALLGRRRRLVTVTGLGGIGKTRLALSNSSPPVMVTRPRTATPQRSAAWSRSHGRTPPWR
jgi:transcriptional regulator with XRE-family HTH domain